MRQKSYIHTLLKAVAAMALTCSLQAEQVLKLSFDKGVEPDVSQGFEFAGGSNQNILIGDGINGTPGVEVGGASSLQYNIDNQITDQLFEANEGTVELWVRLNNWPLGENDKFFTFLSADMEGENNQLLIYKWKDSNDIYFLAGDASLEYEKKPLVAASIEGWNENDWHQLTMTWNGRQLACYVDGELISRRNIDESRHWQTYGFNVKLRDKLRIGAPQMDPAFPSAQVDDVVIFNECLTEGQVKSRFNSRKNDVSYGDELHLPVPVVTEAPAIDGRLSPGEWDHATSFTGFVEGINARDANLFPLANTVFLKHDSEYLYVGLKSKSPEGGKLRANALHDDRPDGELEVWKDDCFEVLLAAELSQQAVRMFQVNSLGSGKEFQGYNPKWKSLYRKAASADKDYFYAELAIPLKELHEHAYQQGENIYLQISRSYKPQGGAMEYAMLNSAMSLTDVARYAKLSLTNLNEGVVFDFKQNDLEKGEMSLDGSMAKNEATNPRTSPQATLFNKDASKETVVEGGWKGDKFEVRDALPGGTYAVNLKINDVFSVTRNFEVKRPLDVSKRIWSDRMEMDLKASLNGITKNGGHEFADLQLEAEIVDLATGKTEAKSTFPIQKREDIYTISIKDVLPGKKEARTRVVTKKDGTILGDQTLPYLQFGPLEGKDSTIGISDKVPEPWTPVLVTPDNTISVWNRKYVFASNFLPKEILVGDENILSGVPYYEVEYADGRVEKITTGTSVGIKKAEATKARIEASSESGSLKVSQASTVEFDGVTKCELAVSGSKDIRRFSMVVPLKAKYAEFFLPLIGMNHTGGTPPMPKNPLVPEGYSWTSPEFFYSLTLTSLDAGFAWFAQSPKTWKVDLGKTYQEVIRKGDHCDMVVHYINTEKSGVRDVDLVYGIQTLPSRPVHPDFRKHQLGNFSIVFEPTTGHYDMLKHYMAGKEVDKETMVNWSVLPQGNFPRGLEDMENPDQYAEIKEWRDEFWQDIQDKDLMFGVYSAPTYSSETMPEWDFFGEEWSGIPKTRFSIFLQPRISVSNEGWVNLYLTNLDRFVRRYPVKILMFDVPDPQGDYSVINGMGYTREDGITYPEYPIWETRELFRRTTSVLKTAHPDGWTIGASECPAYSSFFDYLIRETYLHMIKTRYFEKSWWGLPFEEEMKIWYRINYGPKLMFLPAFSEMTSPPDVTQQIEPSVHHYGLMLLYDLVEWPQRVNYEVRNRVMKIRRLFGFGTDETIKFYPFYDLEGKVTTDDPSIRASVYTAKDKLMIPVVNLSPEKTIDGTVKIDPAQFGFPNGPFVAELYDPIANTFQEVKYTNGSFAIEKIESGMHKVIILTRGDAIPFGKQN